MMIRARVTPSETASVCAPAAALSILKSSRTMQALTPGVSLKVSANRVLVYLRANRCGKICLAACPLAPVEVPWTMCTRFGRRVTPVRAPHLISVRETRLTRVLVDSLRVMKQQFNYFIRRVSNTAPAPMTTSRRPRCVQMNNNRAFVLFVEVIKKMPETEEALFRHCGRTPTGSPPPPVNVSRFWSDLRPVADLQPSSLPRQSPRR